MINHTIFYSSIIENLVVSVCAVEAMLLCTCFVLIFFFFSFRDRFLLFRINKKGDVEKATIILATLPLICVFFVCMHAYCKRNRLRNKRESEMKVKCLRFVQFIFYSKISFINDSNYQNNNDIGNKT